MSSFTENVIEQAALDWLQGLGYATLHGAAIAPGELSAERSDYAQTILVHRLRTALRALNPTIPADALEDAFRRLTRPDLPSLPANNRAMHHYLVDGVPVEYQHEDGFRGDLVRVLNFEEPDQNEFLAVNQFTVIENNHERRADIVIFVNGLPLALIELKSATAENADVWSAFRQVQTYKEQIPALFAHNAVLLISDGVAARVGTLTAEQDRFMPWRTIDGTGVESGKAELQVLLQGVFEPRRFLDLVRHFIVFEDAGAGVLVKKMAGYHQFHAVNVAVEETLRACYPNRVGAGVSEDQVGYFAHPQQDAEAGDKRIGVVWHTQGSGKSLTMAFYAGRIILHPEMENPTIVVITDRNDLDDQLFETFAKCREILRQPPVQAANRGDLRDKLKTAGGGVVFTTIQKFMPPEYLEPGESAELSPRRNIVVIADEAHRSQYDFIDGFARHMRDALPNASFIGFTGTPIERADANTRAVFGDYISVYDIRRAVEDKATVPIYYESRLAKLALDEKERPRLDPKVEEVTEGEEPSQVERLKSKWAQLEALVGSERRIRLVAEDLVRHFERRLDAMDGKAMVVCMSRAICVELYKAITALRPHWHGNDDEKGAIKVVMTGSASDPSEWQRHIRPKKGREAMAKRFKDPNDPFRIVIVRDMWLTGFDVPCLHTMYVDKPMHGHSLMQAIARVNRVFKDKPGGLVVDYLGLADDLRKAMATYTESGGTGQTTIDQDEAVMVMMEKYEICRGLFHGLNWSAWTVGTPVDRLSLLPAAQEHILAQEDGKKRLLDAVSALSKGFALAVPHDRAMAIRDDVGFFQAVRSVMAKESPEKRRSNEDVEHAIKQIVSQALMSDEVVDIFEAAGLKKPDISILSDEFLAEVQNMPHRNLAVELLRKLLNNEIKRRTRTNVVQARSFAAMLDEALRKYQNRAVETAQIIEELVAMAKSLREADRRGEALGLNEAEVAFYDALETNDSAVAVLGDDVLRTIARELVATVRKNTSIDWTMRENVRAKLRVLVKRILRKYKYPPDKEEKATQTVLEQAEVLCAFEAA